jgi:magnesium-transporting ATPase (P-type)
MSNATFSDQPRPVPANPFSQPIRNLEREIVGMQWQFPYFGQVVQLLAILLATAICVLLYCTVGVVAQISQSFRRLIGETHRQMQGASLLEKSAFGIAVLVYCLVYLPAFVVQIPFLVAGWLWARLGSLMTLLMLAAIALLVALAMRGSFPAWIHVARHVIP